MTEKQEKLSESEIMTNRHMHTCTQNHMVIQELEADPLWLFIGFRTQRNIRERKCLGAERAFAGLVS